jgi:hypothetical protein
MERESSLYKDRSGETLMLIAMAINAYNNQLAFYV